MNQLAFTLLGPASLPVGPAFNPSPALFGQETTLKVVDRREVETVRPGPRE